MEISKMLNQVPPTIFVAIGVFLAALIGGFFSYLNMITQKENKVSEFRREWIDELRNQIALYTSSIQNLSVISNHRDNYKGKRKDDPFKDVDILEMRKDAIESITKMTLMLNHKAASSDKNSHEAALLKATRKASKKLAASDYNGVLKSVTKIRKTAAPLLKANWETVKRGEKLYQIIKRLTGAAYLFVMPATFIGGVLYLHMLTSKQQDNLDEIERAIQSMRHFNEALPLHEQPLPKNR